MSLLGMQGGRTSGTERSIKEGLLNEQIAKLREIYHDSSVASEKVLACLKKAIAFKNRREQSVPTQSQPQAQSQQQVATLNHFMEDLSSIEDSLITLIENCEADKEQFVSSVIFRTSEKDLAGKFFRTMMKSHEEFKERLNVNILRLEKDIQALESNGFHIYDSAPRPNNVLAALKRHTLDKFLLAQTETQTIFLKIKAHFSAASKPPLPHDFKNEVQKIREYCKFTQQICLKEKLRNAMLLQEIRKAKLGAASEASRLKLFQCSIKATRAQLRANRNQILIETDPNAPANTFRDHLASLKQSADKHMLFTPKLYKTPALRSKSCHTIVVRQSEEEREREREKEELSLGGKQMQGGISEVTIMGCDFLEESMQN